MSHLSQVIEHLMPKFNVAIKPGVGLTLHLSEATVRLTTGWGVAYQKGILRFRNNGSGEVIVNGTGIDLELSLEVDKDGRLLLAAKSCIPRVGGILYRLEDEAMFYDLVIQLVSILLYCYNPEQYYNINEFIHSFVRSFIHSSIFSFHYLIIT